MIKIRITTIATMAALFCGIANLPFNPRKKRNPVRTDVIKPIKKARSREPINTLKKVKAMKSK